MRILEAILNDATTSLAAVKSMPELEQTKAKYLGKSGSLTEQLKSLGYATGQMSVDIYEAPAVAQSWFVLERIRQIAAEHGAAMQDVVKLVQYFRDLRHYPFYNRVRGLFYTGEPPVSTVVEVARFMPGDGALIEVEATIYLPKK